MRYAIDIPLTPWLLLFCQSIAAERAMLKFPMAAEPTAKPVEFPLACEIVSGPVAV